MIPSTLGSLLVTGARERRTHGWLFVLALLCAEEAHVARMADVAQHTFTYEGAAAEQIGALLELRPPHKSHTFPLSQGTELMAMRYRDAALRDASGVLPPDLDHRASTLASVTATRTASGVTLQGWMLDRTTAFPPQAGPRFAFYSPMFREPSLTLGGWRALFEKLRSLPGRSVGHTVVRGIEVTLGNGDRATLELITVMERDSHQEERHQVGVAVGAMLASVVRSGPLME